MVRDSCIRDPLPHASDGECFAEVERQQRIRDILADHDVGVREVEAAGEAIRQGFLDALGLRTDREMMKPLVYGRVENFQESPPTKGTILRSRHFEPDEFRENPELPTPPWMFGPTVAECFRCGAHTPKTDDIGKRCHKAECADGKYIAVRA